MGVIRTWDHPLSWSRLVQALASQHRMAPDLVIAAWAPQWVPLGWNESSSFSAAFSLHRSHGNVEGDDSARRTIPSTASSTLACSDNTTRAHSRLRARGFHGIVYLKNAARRRGGGAPGKTTRACMESSRGLHGPWRWITCILHR